MHSETGHYHPEHTEPSSETIAEQNDRYYREAVEAYIQELYPTDTPEKQEKQPIATDQVSAELERRVHAQFVADILPEYGVPQEVVAQLTEVEGDGMQLWELPQLEQSPAHNLPQDYAFCGGVARADLLKKLGLDPHAGYRDMDVLRIGGSADKTELDKKLENEYMPEDSEHGYGVQRYQTTDQYFATRDLTISEVLSDRNGIVFTPQCLLDTVRGIIRLSEFERTQLESLSPKTKILAKAIRLYAQGMVEFGNPHLDREIIAKANKKFIAIFNQALHLIRAIEHSGETATRYIQILHATKSLPTEIQSAEEAAAFYAARLRDKSALFREAPVTQYLFENDLLAHVSTEVESALTTTGEIRAMDYGSLDLGDPMERIQALSEAKKHLDMEMPVAEPDKSDSVDDAYDEQFADLASGTQKRFKLR